MKNVNYGTGSGAINITGMAQLGLVSGDTLTIVPGTYSGGSINNLNGVNIIMAGKVVLTGTITMAGLVNINFDWVVCNSNHQDNFVVKGHCEGIVFAKGGRTGSGIFWNASGTGLKYTGQSTTALFNCAILNFLDDSSGSLFQGDWGSDASTLLNVVDGIEIGNYTCTNPTTNILARGGGVYRYNYHDWKLPFNPQTGLNSGDNGIIFHTGNGNVKNIKRYGGWGWTVRQFGASLGTKILDSVIENIIDITGTGYGTIDVRNDPAYANGGVVGTNYFIYNNTNGNKVDSYGGKYTTAVVLIANNQAPYKIDIRNNVAYNSATANNGNGGTNGILLWSTINVTSTNNKYYTDWKAAGFSDDINAQIVNGSPLIGAGIATINTTDYNGNTRPNPPSIGATELIGVPNKVPISNAGPDQTITLPIAQAILDGSASYDPDGNITAWAWKQLSGPNQAAILNGNTSRATISGLIAGTYSLNLAVTDNTGAVTNSSTKVVVNAAPKKIVKTITTVDYVLGTQSQAVFYSDGTNIVTTLP